LIPVFKCFAKNKTLSWGIKDLPYRNL